MEILRWFLAIVSLGYFGVCMIVLTQLAIQRIRTGKSASGLAFVGATVGFAGILILPVSTFATRLPLAFIPFFVESIYFVFNLLIDWRSTKKQE